MMKIIIYFVGGQSSEFSECDKEGVEKINKWLANDEENIFKINSVNIGRETLIRKDLILYIHISDS